MRLLFVVALTACLAMLSSCSGDSNGALSLGRGADAGAAEPGSRQIFPDLTFPGVLSAATASTQAVVSTSDYSDPQGLRYNLLHVIAIFMWCPHCNNETYNLATIAGWQASQRVAVIQIAMQGYDSAAPTWSDVQKWAPDHDVAFPVLMDGQGAQLGKYFPVSAVPVNIVVNPRTMEVLAVDVGEVDDNQAYEQGFLSGL